MARPEHVRIYEVGPRDGLQNEPRSIPLAAKRGLIAKLADAGLRDIEVGAFVSPKWVPQMADTGLVLAGLDYAPAINYAVLVPNLRGWEAYRAATRALPRVPGEVALFIAATEGFSRANLNCSIAESLERLAPVAAAAGAAGVALRGYVSCVTDCPYDGPVAPAAVARAVAGLQGLAAMPVSLGDTIGAGRPETVGRMLEAVLEVLPADRLAGHFHDTGGRALANIEVALGLGLRVFDSAVGGLGGCPYAPGAPGNVATEAVAAHLEKLGYATGLDHGTLAEAARMAQRIRAGKGAADADRHD